MEYFKYLLLFLGLFNLGLVFGMCLYKGYDSLKFVLRLTAVNTALYSTYTILSFALNTKIFDSAKRVKLISTVKNTLFKWVFAFNCTTAVAFWTLRPLGESILHTAENNVELFFEIYLHAGVPLLVLTDLFVAKHFNSASFFLEYLLVTLLYWFMALIALFLAKSKKEPIYEFLVTLSTYECILLFSVIFMVLICCSLLYNWLTTDLKRPSTQRILSASSLASEKSI